MNINFRLLDITTAKNSPYSELFWSAFFPHFPTCELNTKRYSPIVGKWGKNANQNNSEYGHFLRSEPHEKINNIETPWSLHICLFVVRSGSKLELVLICLQTLPKPWPKISAESIILITLSYSIFHFCGFYYSYVLGLQLLNSRENPKESKCF